MPVHICQQGKISSNNVVFVTNIILFQKHLMWTVHASYLTNIGKKSQIDHFHFWVWRWKSKQVFSGSEKPKSLPHGPAPTWTGSTRQAWLNTEERRVCKFVMNEPFLMKSKWLGDPSKHGIIWLQPNTTKFVISDKSTTLGKMQVQGLVDLPHIPSNHLIHTNTMPEIVCTAPSLEPFPTKYHTQTKRDWDRGRVHVGSKLHINYWKNDST